MLVESVLAQAEEDMERKYKYLSKGCDLDTVIEKAAKAFKITPEEITVPGKNPVRVQARSVAAYWAVRHLSISGVEVVKKTGHRSIGDKPCG
ncbi:MAG: hypothetical protein V2J07_05085 [Anaerolineae bacterium]|jgi:chromosomal replication initiation ATPase DnaA|nr:hypothetical protein [Anaerolineae bacterium]